MTMRQKICDNNNSTLREFLCSPSTGGVDVFIESYSAKSIEEIYSATYIEETNKYTHIEETNKAIYIDEINKATEVEEINKGVEQCQ